jgi:GNAT superfamily N-acetyltransferase
VRLTSQGFSHLRLMRLLPARAPHLDLLWDLLMATPDYSLLITRRLPTRQDAWELLNDCPAGITAQDKLVLAIMDEQHIVGCIDLVPGYPTPETAFLALLQLRPAAQGQGLGSAMLCEIMAQAAAWLLYPATPGGDRDQWPRPHLLAAPRFLPGGTPVTAPVRR